jgi:cytochrome c553
MKKLLTVLVLAACGGSALAADVVGNPKAAPNKIEMCIGCHGIPGYKASFPEVYQVPMIGGQSARYIESALHAYKKGERKHPSMRGIAASLSDQDIADVAAYYSQQNAQSRK